MSIDIYKDL